MQNNHPIFNLAAAVVLSLLSASCGKKEAPRPAAETPKPPAISDSKIDAEVLEALAPAPSEKADTESGLEAQAEDILSRFPNKDAVELLNVPEVNAALKAGLTKLSQDKALQDQINNSAAIVARLQGFSGAPGTVGLDLDLKSYDYSRKSRMLQAVMSEDPRQIVRFITEEVGEAAPELTLGGADRASNGVAIKQIPPPPAK